MQRKTIAILVTLIVVPILVVLGGLGFLVWRIYKILPGAPPTPTQLKQPRVVVGANFLSKKPFVEASFLGEITEKDSIGEFHDISVGEWDDAPGLDVVIAGSEGAFWVDLNGKKKKKVLFQLSDDKSDPLAKEVMILGATEIVDLESDGKCEFLARGSLDGAALWDHQGKRLWRSEERKEEEGFLSNVTVGDLNGDGVAEIVVSWEGIRVFDKAGRQLARRDDEYSDSQIEVVDYDGDGANEIISLSSMMTFRDKTGEVTNKNSLPDFIGYLGDFSLLKRPSDKQPLLLIFYEGDLLLLNLKGEVVTKIKAPLSEFDDTVHHTIDDEKTYGTSVYKSEGKFVKITQDNAEFLAVISNFAGIDRAVFDVFDSNGTLMYQEVLPEKCSAVATIPIMANGTQQAILVGCDDIVWSYQIK